MSIRQAIIHLYLLIIRLRQHIIHFRHPIIKIHLTLYFYHKQLNFSYHKIIQPKFTLYCHYDQPKNYYPKIKELYKKIKTIVQEMPPTNKAHLHFFQRLRHRQKRQKSFSFFPPKEKKFPPLLFLFLGHRTCNKPVASKYRWTI